MQKNGQPGSEKKKPGAHTPKDGRPHSGNKDRPSSGQRTSGIEQNERAEDRKRPGSGKGKVLYKKLVRFFKLAKMACCPPPFAKAGDIKTHSSIC